MKMKIVKITSSEKRTHTSPTKFVELVGLHRRNFYGAQVPKILTSEKIIQMSVPKAVRKTDTVQPSEKRTLQTLDEKRRSFGTNFVLNLWTEFYRKKNIRNERPTRNVERKQGDDIDPRPRSCRRDIWQENKKGLPLPTVSQNTERA